MKEEKSLKEPKEAYPRELFAMIVDYAKKYSEISKIPLIQVLKEKTPIYFFIGNYSWDIDPDSEYSKEFKYRIKQENIADVVYEMQVKNYKRLSKEEDWFGCFKYKYIEDKKTGDKLVKIHFRNADYTEFGPLAHENTSQRINELKEMFTEIKTKYPQTKYVQGSTWLYNYESYCRLFPQSYTEDMKSMPPKTQYMVIWGQFIDSEKKIKNDLHEEFQEKLHNADTLEDLLQCFRYKGLIPKGKIEEFYEYLGVN